MPAGLVESVSNSNSAAYSQADNAISSAISDAVAKVNMGSNCSAVAKRVPRIPLACCTALDMATDACIAMQVKGGADATATANATSQAIATAIATAYASASSKTTVQGRL